MNKIIVNDDSVELKTNSSLDIDVYERQDIFDVTKLKIDVKKNTDLIIEYNNQGKSKIDVEINIYKDVKFKLFEIKEGYEVKVQYKYNLDEYSNVLVNKFYDVDIVKELDVIKLNGESSEINYNFNTIAKDKQNIDIVVYHNNKNTISNLNNKAVSILKGSVTFNVTGTVYNGITNCIVNQNNKIINLNDKKSTINPILLIDENDVEANHSALIGKFSDEELFYLMSRGISKENALNLLVKGFLKLDINNKKIDDIIDKYWR